MHDSLFTYNTDDFSNSDSAVLEIQSQTENDDDQLKNNKDALIANIVDKNCANNNDTEHDDTAKFSLLNWNINGLSARLTDPDFIDYILSFDLCVLTETFTLPSFDFSVYFSDFLIFHSPAEKLSKMGHCSGGVVVMINKKFEPYIKEIKTQVENVICIKISKQLFGGYNDVHLIALYNHDSKSVFYDNKDYSCTLELVEQFMLTQLDSDVNVEFLLIGDLNARIGDWSYDDDMNDIFENNTGLNLFDRKSEDIIVNNFGKKLIQLCTMFELTPLNGLCHFDCDDSFTFLSERGNSLIDYFIASPDFSLFTKKLSVQNRVETHHMPVVLEIKNAINRSPNDIENDGQVHQTEILKWDPLKANIYCTNILSEQTASKFEDAILKIDDNIDEALNLFIDIVLDAGSCMKRNVIFDKKKRISKPWYDKECRDAKKDTNKLLRHFRSSREYASPEVQKQKFHKYSQQKSVYDNMLKEKRLSYKQNMRKNLVDKRKDMNSFWSCIRKMKPRENKDVNIKIDQWQNHFSHVLGSTDHNVSESEPAHVINDCNLFVDLDTHAPDTNHETHELDVEITEDEVIEAIRNLKNNKAPGLDSISAEFLKSGQTAIVPFLTKLFNEMFNRGYFPISWCQSVIVPLFKKGDHNNPDNYRGISLLNVTSKLFTFILNKRLYKWSEKEEKICQEQAGFRRNFSTIDQIYTLITMIRKSLHGQNKGKFYVLFVDYAKAFDSVNRDKLWNILTKIKTSVKMLSMLKGLYCTVQSCVRWKHETSGFFNCPQGVKQGCILSPLIFSLFVNEVAKHVSSNCKHGFQFLPGLREICLLLFADDICLFSTTPSGLQNQINNLERSSKALGLNVNLNKTKVMVFRKGGHLSKAEKWYYDGKLIQVVNSYKYLGFNLSTRLSFDVALEDFCGRAKKKIVDIIRTMYNLGSIDVNMFFQLFDAQVKPMLLYASEIWGTTKYSVIESVHLFACKRILNVSPKTPNIMVYGELGRYPLFIDSTISAVRYLFKLRNMNDERFPQQAMKMENQSIERHQLNQHANIKHSWLVSVKNCFERYGFADVYNGVTRVGDVKMFSKLFKQRMIDCYMQEWHAKLTESERYNIYKTFKDSLFQEYYMNCITISKFRTVLTRFRLGINDLNINNRYNDNTKLCPFCENIENETHFLLQCTKYKLLREKYIWKHFNNDIHVNVADILQKENKTILRDVAMYIYYALKLREDTLKLFICK